MNSHIEEERRALYAGGDLPEAEAAAVGEHVAACPRCNALLGELERTRGLAGIFARETPPPLDADFTMRVMDTVNAAQAGAKPELRRPFLVTWHKVAAAAAILVAVFWAGRLSKNAPEEMRAAIETPAVSAPEGVTVDGRFLQMLPVEGPLPLDKLPESTAGVYIVLYRSQPDTAPDRYTVEYIGEHSPDSGDIRNDIACLLDRAASRENIFIVLYPMPTASEAQRARVAQALIQAYKPYCNNGV